MKKNKQNSPLLLLLLLPLFLFGGCEKKIEKRIYEEVFIEAEPVVSQTSSMEDPHAAFQHPPIPPMLEMGSNPADPQVAALQASVVQESLIWKVPDGWVEKPGSGMRLASFDIATDLGKAETSIVSLSGIAGGLVLNVERWMGQINLQFPAGMNFETFLAQQETLHSHGGLNGKWLDFTLLQPDNPKMPSLFVTVFESTERTLFVKMTGPRQTLLDNRGKFKTFCESIAAPV